MIIYKDKKYNFIELFNPDNGFLIRSDILDKPGCDPTQRSYPELLDIGIMGKCHISHLSICKKAGIDCYQKAIDSNSEDMSSNDYECIMNEFAGKVFQVALGGAGDPNKHKEFKTILELTVNANIVPNLTTSGMFLTNQEIELMKEHCGAVAVSFYSRLKSENGKLNESNPETLDSIERLCRAGCCVNIHYVISKETVSEAIYRLKNKLFPQKVNAIIFILYKPTGFGKSEKILNGDEREFKEFLELVGTEKFDFRIGFDTCCTPAILTNCKNVSGQSLDFCEASRFSMYIDSELNAYPCSFDCCTSKYKVSMRNKKFEEVWWSKEFESFRIKQEASCKNCIHKEKCLGGCALDLTNICSLKK